MTALLAWLARHHFPLLGFALLIGLAGNIAQIQKITAFGLIIWCGGVILTSFGWARGKQFWPPVVHLCFMLPLPFLLYAKTSIALQFVSSEIGVGFIRMMNIPVFLDGNIIDLDEHVDTEEGVFFMRVAWQMAGFSLKTLGADEARSPGRVSTGSGRGDSERKAGPLQRAPCLRPRCCRLRHWPRDRQSPQ